MKAPWLLILQVVLIICWYAVPGMALAPAFLIFLPTIIAVLLLTFTVGGLIIGALIAARN